MRIKLHDAHSVIYVSPEFVSYGESIDTAPEIGRVTLPSGERVYVIETPEQIEVLIREAERKEFYEKALLSVMSATLLGDSFANAECIAFASISLATTLTDAVYPKENDND